MTRVLVWGGRSYQDRECVFSEMDRLDNELGISLVIHGACMKNGTIKLQGADRWAEEWARQRERPYIGFPAKWTQSGAAAGPIRNREMVRRMKPEFGLGFPGGPGSADMAKRARSLGIEVRVIEKGPVARCVPALD